MNDPSYLPAFGDSDANARRRYAMMLLQQGMESGPVGHPLGALARAIQGGMGGYELGQAERQEKQDRTSARELAIRLEDQRYGAPSGPTAAPRSASLPPQTVMPPMDNEPPRMRPPGSPPIRQATEGLASVDGLPYASAGMQRAAMNELAEGLRAGQTGAYGENAQMPPFATGFMPDRGPQIQQAAPQQQAAPPQQPPMPPAPPAGQMPPPQPPMPPAPMQQPSFQPPRIDPAIRDQALRALQSPSVDPMVKKMIAERLNPGVEIKIIEGHAVAFDKRTGAPMGVVFQAPDKPTDDSKNFDAINRQRRAAGLTPYRTQEEASAARKASEETAQLQAKSDFTKTQSRPGEVRQGNLVIDELDRSMDKITASPRTTTGIGGAILQNFPGFDAHNVAKLVETVRSNIGFSELNRMRQESPTGAALGNVTERELSELQAMAGNLALSQDDKQLLDNMRRLKNRYLDVINGEGNGPRERLQYQQPRQPPRQQNRQPQDGDIAVGPRGERIMLRNGRWEPVT